jgi:hypothetical protein
MPRHVHNVAFDGLLAGIVGALCMSVFAMLGSAVAGKPWYLPLELAGGLATGSTARFDVGLQAGVALAGAILHFAIGAAWGVLYGLFVGNLMGELQPKESLSLGALFGILVWVIDLFTLMPKFDPAAARAIPLWFGAVSHIGYGAVVGATFHYYRVKHDGQLDHGPRLDLQRH